jgi:hypothetical protein
MTGKAAGLCAGFPSPRYTTPRFGRGNARYWDQGLGRGYWGRGRRFWYKDYNYVPFNQPSTEEEKVYLENLVKNLEDELKTVKDRLRDLTKEKKDS